MDEVWFNHCFRERSLRNNKKSSTLRLTDSQVFMVFEIVQVYLPLAGCREHKGHLQNE